MSLADVIMRFATQDADGVPAGYVVTRTTPGGYDSTGNVVDGTLTTLLIVASVQPYSGRELKVLPEGARTSDVRVIDTETPLQESPIPDHIVIRGDDYAIFKVDGPTSMGGFSLYTAYAARQVETP